MSDRVEIQPYLNAVVMPTIKDVARSFAGYVELDDLLQEAAVWWYGQGQVYLPTYLAEDANLVRLRRSIWRHCAGYARGEKASRLGYHPEDQVVYQASEIEKLLPIALNSEGLPDGGGTADLSGIRAHGNLAEGGNVLAGLVDVRRAIGALSGEDLQLLTMADEFQADWERIAPYFGIEADSVRRKHARVIARMARFLNRHTPEEYAA